MRPRTAGVKQLVAEVLGTLPQPYTEDVIADVFQGIEGNAGWRRRYDHLCDELTKTVVNNWCGVWTERLVGGTAIKEVPTKGNALSESYSKLALDGAKTRPSLAAAAGEKSRMAGYPRTTTSKISEAAALQMMSDYFQKNKLTLPPSVRKHRERIVELLMAGHSAEEAFSMVIA